MAAPPFLLIDTGNTRLKWATAHARGRITPAGEVATQEESARCIAELAEIFPEHRVVLSCVVPRLVPIFQRAFPRRLFVVTGTSPLLGLTFRYPNPGEIGADRLASSVAVHAMGVWPVIAVNCGTATAFTVLDAQGRLCGGVIAPGVQTQLASLLGATAQLPGTVLRRTRHYLARTTEDAIRAGVLLNFQGGVKEILRRLGESLPLRGPVRIVVTGGNAHFLSGVLDVPVTFKPLLVFEGLRMIGLRAFADVS